MPELTFEVYCAKCGAGLCNQTSVDHRNNVNVEPCERCLDQAFSDGKDEGIEEGRM